MGMSIVSLRLAACTVGFYQYVLLPLASREQIIIISTWVFILLQNHQSHKSQVPVVRLFSFLQCLWDLRGVSKEARQQRGLKKIVRGKSRSMFNIDQEIIMYKYSQTIIFNWLWSDKSLQQDSFRKIIIFSTLYKNSSHSILLRILHNKTSYPILLRTSHHVHHQIHSSNFVLANSHFFSKKHASSDQDQQNLIFVTIIITQWLLY